MCHVSWLADAYTLVRSYILANCYQNFIYVLSFSVRVDLFSLQGKYQLKRDVKTQWLYANRFIISIYFPAENSFQISYFWSQIQGSFTCPHQPKTIFLILSAHVWLSRFANFKIQLHRLTSWYSRSQLCLPTINLLSGKVIKKSYLSR